MAFRNIVVFQHIECEHPGVFRDYLAEDGVNWTPVELDEGEPVPGNLADYDALIVMGGPMDVWQEAEHPWLVGEKAAIRHWVRDLKRPFLGLCLGHQLLADALGGKVGKAATPEIGMMTVKLTPEGRAHTLFQGSPDSLPCLQWHSAEVTELPDGATILASSPACSVNAFAYGAHAFGMQYHIEITSQTVAEWAVIPEYRSALEHALGSGAADRLKVAADAKMAELNSAARTIYGNFKTIAESC